jgi:flavin reductase (DIM6/NTAB) family NADH-FMN oxidoreductase RutF
MDDPALRAEPPSTTDEAYRDVMQHWPSGVAVLTLLGPEGPHGMTASAFTSVSIHPPLVLIVVDKRWRSHDWIQAAGHFCVNILSTAQSEVADRFAGRLGPMPDRFAGIDVGRAVTGAPFLKDSVAYLDCVVAGAHVAGDHTIYVGRVVAAAELHADARPLLYHRREYARLAEVDESGPSR